MLLDIDLRLLFGSCSNPCVARGFSVDSIQSASNPTEQFRARGYQWLLNMSVDLSNHDPLIRVALDNSSTNSTQTVLYRLQCTITLNIQIYHDFDFHQKWELNAAVRTNKQSNYKIKK
jgi:hypothetical protein